MKKLILGALGIAILTVGISTALPVQTRPQPAFGAAGASDKYDGDCTGNETEGRCADKPLFDHSGCQYPDRWSNPAYGCDNSDPAVPECIKAMYSKEAEDACIAAFVADHQTQPAQPPKAAQCGGK